MRRIKFWRKLAILSFGSISIMLCLIHFWMILALIGTLLISIPPWRRWFVKQPGYVNLLSLFPGWLPRKKRFWLFLVPLVYVLGGLAFFKWFVPAFYGAYSSGNDAFLQTLYEPTSIPGNVLGLVGLVIFYYFFTGSRILTTKLPDNQQLPQTHPLLDHRLPYSWTPQLQLTIADEFERRGALRRLLSGKPTVAKWDKMLAMANYSFSLLPQLALGAYMIVFGTVLGSLCYYGILLVLRSSLVLS